MIVRVKSYFHVSAMRSFLLLTALVGVVAGASPVPQGGSAPKIASAIVEGTGTDTTKWRCRCVR